MAAAAQNERLLDKLASGHAVTQLDCYLDLGITRLSARIYDLRQAGHNILGEWCKTTNRFNEPCSFKRYRMAPQKVTLSEHAETRMRKRFGLNRKACLRKAELAMREGRIRGDVKGKLRDYMDTLARRHEAKCNAKLYGEDVFVFALDGTLITVWPLAADLRKIHLRNRACLSAKTATIHQPLKT